MTQEQITRLTTVARILWLRARGRKQEAIARRLRIGQATVSRVLNIYRRTN